MTTQTLVSILSLKSHRLISLYTILSCLKNLVTGSLALELTESAQHFVPISQKVEL